MLVYSFNHIFDLIESQDGHQRTENFLTHHLVIPSDVIHDGRLDLPGIRIEASAADDLIGIDQPGHTVKMLSTDDVSILSVVQRILAVLPLDLCLETFHQLVLDRAVAENIVRSHTGLAAVQEFTEHDPPGRQFQLGALIHNTGTLSTQLQGHRSHVRSCLFQHQLANSFAAGEEDIIKFLFQQASIFLTATLDHRNVFILVQFADQFLQ